MVQQWFYNLFYILVLFPALYLSQSHADLLLPVIVWQRGVQNILFPQIFILNKNITEM